MEHLGHTEEAYRDARSLSQLDPGNTAVTAMVARLTELVERIGEGKVIHMSWEEITVLRTSTVPRYHGTLQLNINYNNSITI